MKIRKAILAVTLLFLGGLTMASAQGTLFTYQGRLEFNGTPADGLYTFGFLLRDAASGGTLLGNTSQPGVGVTNGVFTVPLDFGNKFDGSPRWLQITVATNGGIPTILHPYQPITPTPYAIFSSQAGSVPNGAIGSAQLANSINLGTTTNNGRLDVYRTAAGTPAISLVGSSSQITTYGNAGDTTAWLGSSATAGGFVQLYQANGNIGAKLDGDFTGTSGGGSLSVRAPSGSTAVFLSGSSSQITTYGNAGDTTAWLGSSATAGGFVQLYQKNGNVGVHLDGDATGTSGGGSIGVRTSDGNSAVFLSGNASGGGGVYARNSTGNNRAFLAGQSTGGGGGLFLYDTDNTTTVALTAAESSTTGSQLVMRQGDGTTTIQLDAEVGTGGGGYLRLYKGDGTAGITLQADVSGESKITTQVLQITGGSDLSEQFDIVAPKNELAPGMIVCIDPEHPGQLVESTKSYDRTVAGVMSGAGGVKPGMLMGQQGTPADGKHPVALSGRVYCEADASNGAIRPGDLLTTSSTPGRAMKVTDFSKAQGAIIGKAMSSLDKGQGLVLVLVSLQ